MDKQAVEAQLCQLPISQYAWIDPQTIEFSDRIRYVCEHECPMYGTSWACPPAVGTVAACRERILSYPGALVFTTLCEVDDIADLSAALATRAPHEAVTRQVRDILRQFSPDVLGLKAFVAAVLGGIGSIPGAMIGGFAIGLLEALVSAVGLSVWKDGVVFAILIVVLLVKPTGILGRPQTEKV